MFKNYKEGDVILEADYVMLQQEIAKKYNSIKKLEENKTVFFNKSVQMSRTEFKKQYPTNKIVHNIKEADYFITKNKPNLYIGFYNKNGRRTLDSTDFIWGLHTVIQDLNNMANTLNNDSIKFISPDNIKFKVENENLPVEIQEKILNMLSSADKETFDLGWKILFEYNHLNCINDFYLIISKANPHGFWKRTKSRIIEQKLKQIKSHFPNGRF